MIDTLVRILLTSASVVIIKLYWEKVLCVGMSLQYLKLIS